MSDYFDNNIWGVLDKDFDKSFESEKPILHRKVEEELMKKWFGEEYLKKASNKPKDYEFLNALDVEHYEGDPREDLFDKFDDNGNPNY